MLSGCVSEVNFEEPQPTDAKDETHFKRRLIGDYINTDDGSRMTVGKDFIIRQWDFRHNTANFQIDSLGEFKTTDGMLSDSGNQGALKWNVKIDGDTARIEGSLIDTIFRIGKDQVLRNFKGYSFLNAEEENGFWTVTLLSSEGQGKVTLKKLRGDSINLEKLKTLVVSDEIDDVGSTVFRIKPSRRELKRILHSDLFKDESAFQKIR
ncbi:MAG: hypothetical protein GC178_16910 [Flavobacteriales bacterium]|nr:hypothetical protein [Flavobacteriales bacterium]